MEKRTEKMSKWRNVFHHIEVQLTATDTSLRRWKVDGPTHYLTINRLIKLIPQNTTSNYSLNGGHNKDSTVYNHLMVLFKKAGEEEGEE